MTTAKPCNGNFGNPANLLASPSALKCSTLQTLILSTKTIMYDEWDVSQLTDAFSCKNNHSFFIHKRCHTFGSIWNGIFELTSLPSENSSPLFCSYDYKKVLFNVTLCESCKSEYVQLLFCNLPCNKVALPFVSKNYKLRCTQTRFQYKLNEIQDLEHDYISNGDRDPVALSKKEKDRTERRASAQVLIQHRPAVPAGATNQFRPVAGSIKIDSQSNKRQDIIDTAIGKYFSKHGVNISVPFYHITYRYKCGVQYVVNFKLKKRFLLELS